MVVDATAQQQVDIPMGMWVHLNMLCVLQFGRPMVEATYTLEGNGFLAPVAFKTIKSAMDAMEVFLANDSINCDSIIAQIEVHMQTVQSDIDIRTLMRAVIRELRAPLENTRNKMRQRLNNGQVAETVVRLCVVQGARVI